MKKAEVVLKTLYYREKRFILRKDFEEVCEKYGIDSKSMVKYLLKKEYLIRIFRGIFYLKDPSEIKMGYITYSSHEMVAEGLHLKGIKNWYFGQYSGLKYNNMTHEYFTSDFIINDTIHRTKPTRMNDARFKFIKLKPSMFEFGLVEEKTKNGVLIRYSDKEKTIMDFAYLWKQSGKGLNFIIPRIEEYIDQLDIKKMEKYTKYYPKWMKNLIGKLNA